MEIVIVSVEKIAEFLVSPVVRQVGYIYSYNRNVAVLKDRVQVLKYLRDDVRMRCDHAEMIGEFILPAVRSWVERVDELIAEASISLEGEVQLNESCCPTLMLKLRIKISRIAVMKTAIADELIFHGNFERLSLPVRPATIFGFRGGDEVFESRRSTFKVVMEAIRDDEINMIGVWGMGGVGKTTLVKQFGKQAQDDRLFDDLVMAIVSQTPNLTRIQGQLADMLGLEFDEESVEGRARRLRARLGRTRSALVILDDVWEPIDLEDIGIPFGAQRKGCKIVITSRSEDVLHRMGAQKVILVDLLPEQEAWDLFRKMAGDSVNSPHLQPLALKVVEKCGGLPIAIATVANKLRGGKCLYEWEDALNNLARGSVNDKVHSTLQLSFDHLPSDEIKAFFLLFCIFEENANIAIEDVWKYGLGLGLFQGVDTMEQGRDRAYALADTLIFSSLLQKGIGKDSVKMHPAFRDFALSIASKDEHGFLVTSGPWRQVPQVEYTRYTTISLTSHEIIELPTHALDCPNLQFLYLQFKQSCLQFIPDNFFSRMKKLKVLVMSGMRLLSLPQSLMDLDLHLQTLCLEWCTLKDLSIIGSLQTLKILSLVGSNIEELPREMGELTRLETLDLSQCQQLRTIPHHVILRLSRLQLLYMPGHPERSNFGILDNGRRDEEIENVGLKDLIHVARSPSLKIHLDDANSLPEELISGNLSTYQISIGLCDVQQEHFLYSKALTLKSLSTSHLKLLTPCFKTAEYLYLEEIKGLTNVVFDSEIEGLLLNLKYLTLTGCTFNYLDTHGEIIHAGSVLFKTKYLDTHGDNIHAESAMFEAKIAFPLLEQLEIINVPELQAIWDEKIQHPSFSQLKFVRVKRCERLLNVVTLSLGFPFANLLETLSVEECESVLKIFVMRGGVTIQSSSNLRNLDLRKLPKLKHIIWWDKYPVGTLSFENLGCINIHYCNSLESLFTSSIAKTLVQLLEMKIYSCEMIETIIAEERDGEENSIGIIVFPQLHTLVLGNLPNLKTFCTGRCGIHWPSLKVLQVWDCAAMNAAFTSNIQTNDQVSEGVSGGKEFGKVSEEAFEKSSLYITKQPFFERKTSYNNKGKDAGKKALPTMTPLHDQLEELQGKLNYIKKALGKLKIMEDGTGNSIKEGLHSADGIVREVTEVSRASFQPNLFQNKLHELNGFITELERMVLSEDKMNFFSADAQPSLSTISNGYDHQNSYDRFSNLHLYPDFKRCPAFQNIRDAYESLQVRTSHCLLCIAAFPENETLMKRFLIYWWIGAGIIPHGFEENTAEDIAEDVLKELLEKGLIEPVNKKQHKLVVNSFNMNPLIRSVVIMLAQRARLFDGNANFVSYDKAWLVKSDAGYSLLNSPNLDKGNIKTMLNVSESHPSFELNWFSQMENLNVLYMGRSANNHHIDVQDTEFLGGLSIMKQLKFFSLQGTSGIMKLSDSICRLTNLTILDLRACHNLEQLPEGIDSLQNLTHLDMSECYFLVHMPKGLALLKNLQILKGFVIGDHPESKNMCTLDDLILMRKLRKLSISRGRENFPTKHELSAFRKLKSLCKLTIEWGVRSSTEPMTAVTVKPRIKKALSKLLTINQDRVTVSLTSELPAERKELSTTPELPVELEELSTTPELPAALEKLDLRCFPGETTPSWLTPGKLPRLKKLYIRGGKLGQFNQVQEENGNKWKVEILRLKYLRQLKMEWNKLHVSFPDLVYLEKVECSQLTSFPCDEGGVWSK